MGSILVIKIATWDCIQRESSDKETARVFSCNICLIKVLASEREWLAKSEHELGEICFIQTPTFYTFIWDCSDQLRQSTARNHFSCEHGRLFRLISSSWFSHTFSISFILLPFFIFILVLVSFSCECKLVGFHCSLSDSKSPQIFRTLLCITVNIKNS